MSGKQTLVIAHRGFSAVAAENTMLAFQKAQEARADGIEIDVHFTRDGEVVVLHDERVNRTTNGTGNVVDHTLEELQRLDAGSWFGEQSAGQQIPTFRQVCQFLAEWGGFLNVELKTNRFVYPGIENSVFQLVKEYGISKQVFISSFNHESLLRFKEVAPDMGVAPLYSEIMFQPWAYARTFAATGIHPSFRSVTKEMVDQSHAVGVEVRPWTIDDPVDMQRMIDNGVDAVITNRPDLLLEVLGR